MTDKEKIREEVKRKLDVMQYQIHRKDVYKELKNILDYIDSLQEEPVSEELEEAADSYIKTHGEILGFGRQTFKAGAKWQKEQMMVKTVETTFNVSLPSGLYDKLRIKGCKDGDKLLVIKKDEL